MSPMTERYMYEQPNKLKADGSNYREWCVKTRAKINQQKLGKYLQPCYDPDGKYKSGLEMDDDLVALSYIQLSVHNDHLKYIQHVETTYDTWNALKAIYENTSEVSLVTLQMKMYKLDWSERIGLESFADQFQELTRKMTAAGDGTPERSHVTRFLCLLPPRFANTVSYITRESRDTTKFATMRSVLEELKLDDERQQLSNPSLRKNADKSDDALNATVNGECHYCHKAGHFRSECRRRQNDEAKGVQRRNVRDKPQGNGGGRGSYDGGRNGGRFSGRGRGRNGGNGRGGGRPNWRGADYGNYAEEDEMEDIFMIEEDLPVTSCPDDEDTWWQTDVDPAIEPETDDVSTELCQYATDETDECNAAAMYVREAIIDSGATAHMTGDIDLLHSVVACARGVRLADGHPIPVTAMGDLKIKSDETGRTATFKNVLYVPTLKKTLVSISRINRQSNDASLVFKKDHCQLRNKNKLSITARWNDSYLYAIQGKFILPGINDEANMAEAADAMLWHARMGHIPAGSMAAASKASIGGPTDLPKTITCEDYDDDQRDGRRGATTQATKEDIDMDPADTPLLPQHSASGTTSERSKSPPGRKTSPARLMGQPFGHYPPQITRHDTRNSRRITTTGATPVVAVAPTHEEEPRESRWDRSHRPSTKKQSTSPGRTKQTAMDGLDAARHAARATAVESKRSASRNKIRANATTAQPERKASDRGQSPHKTMRTEGTRGVATKVPWQHPIDQDDSSDAANAAYDVCFNATDLTRPAG
ncbi:hypothetical protein DYB36_011347 [Aphanomyces astaci]|uniref:Retrovirus-related Pol polyprotein from transposon TNT 1-94-like beta-barrel domain-containing protein n=1 Tax=Aphanomyces astaci TaxID=112090 RepID=A0A396ZTF5_APHAT|nr:hypothetical protein DYB36_011347 [Aphanomyces astaci]